MVIRILKRDLMNEAGGNLGHIAAIVKKMLIFLELVIQDVTIFVLFRGQGPDSQSNN